MKLSRFSTMMCVLALCSVYAIAQSPGLGRGGGGGGSSSGGGSRGGGSSSGGGMSSGGSGGGGVQRGGGGGSSSGGGLSRGGGGGSSSGGSSGGGMQRGGGGGSSSGGGMQRGGGGDSGGSRDTGGSRDSGRSRDGSGSSGGDLGRGRSGNLDSGRSRTGPVEGRELGRSRAGNGSLTRGRDPQAPSASGRVRYESNNNLTRANGIARLGAPVVGPGIVRFDAQGFRTHGIVAPPVGFNGLVWNGWRNGYCSYWNNWNDNFFWFPNYVFNPWGPQVGVVISPWWHYPFLPGYLNFNTVVIGNWASPWGWNSGVTYVWDSGPNWGWGGNNWNNRRDPEVDDAIADVRNMFERYDRRALDRLVPRDGQVAILRDGRYDYSLNAPDFYDLLNDLASNAETRRYRIDEVRTARDSMRLVATHEFTDPWGNRQRVFHHFFLQYERGGMVIREFSSSDRRNW